MLSSHKDFVDSGILLLVYHRIGTTACLELISHGHLAGVCMPRLYCVVGAPFSEVSRYIRRPLRVSIFSTRRSFSTGTKGPSSWETTSPDTVPSRACRKCLSCHRATPEATNTRNMHTVEGESFFLLANFKPILSRSCNRKNGIHLEAVKRELSVGPW